MKRNCDVVELKKVMIERGIGTITQLSRISAVSRDTLGKVLNKKEQPSADVMYKLVSALNIPSDRAGKIFFSSNLRKT